MSPLRDPTQVYRRRPEFAPGSRRPDHIQALLRCLTRIQMKSGPPIIEQITPTGSPLGPLTLATVSASITNAAPKAADAGMR